MRVTVTQEDWDKAVVACANLHELQYYNCHCVVAQAIKRQLKTKVYTVVDSDKARVDKDSYRLSGPAQRIVDAFDYRNEPEGHLMKPQLPRTYLLTKEK